VVDDCLLVRKDEPKKDGFWIRRQQRPDAQNGLSAIGGPLKESQSGQTRQTANKGA
jgi:hypothetical protein